MKYKIVSIPLRYGTTKMNLLITYLSCLQTCQFLLGTVQLVVNHPRKLGWYSQNGRVNSS